MHCTSCCLNFFLHCSSLFVSFLLFLAECADSLATAFAKLASGYVIGKVWAFGVHYILHFPYFYRWHRQHHCNPKTLVASRAWQDSLVEYAMMELPSFAMTIILFPTRLWVHLLHFAWHGWDGACSHSGFCAPGVLA